MGISGPGPNGGGESGEGGGEIMRCNWSLALQGDLNGREGGREGTAVGVVRVGGGHALGPCQRAL